MAVGTSTGGMPDWKVSEPNIDLRLHDEPLAYQSSVGRVSFQMDYWQRDGQAPATNVFTLGPGWKCSWQSYVVPADGTIYTAALLYGAGGGEILFTDLTGTVPNYYSNLRLLAVADTNGNLAGYNVFYPSGAVDIYDFLVTDTNGLVSQAYLSRKLDEQGHTTTFVYASFDPTNPVVQLNQVIDADGKTNTLSYTNTAGYNCLIAAVQDPSGHTASFAYDSNGFLTNVTDVAGLSSSFGYGSFPGSTVWAYTNWYYIWYVGGIYNPTNYWLNELTTPYGTTHFTFTDDSLTNFDADGVNRSVVVTEPNGSHQMFVHRGKTSFIESTVDWDKVPTSTPDGSNVDSGAGMVYRNSFYWGRQQFANLSATFLATGSTNWNLTLLTTNDYLRGRWQKWAHASDGGQSDALTMTRDPSPDGSIPGQMTWFTYPGQSQPYNQGTSAMPTLMIRVQPDGTLWYEQYQVDEWGNRTNVISTWTMPDGSVGSRTNAYVYAANGVDLLEAIGPEGVIEAAYGYDGHHQVLFQTNALNEVTRHTYNTNQQVTSTTLPSGLVTTNLYANGFLAEEIVVGFSTNRYTYTNGLVHTHTDERGLAVTNSWDPLQRLTKVAYPDGTTISYTYNKLDLAKAIDRLGNATAYGYNAIRQKIVETNALNQVTSYSYCDCGALEAITDALGNVTHHTHDNQGNLVKTIYPDGSSVTNQYNLLRQRVTQTDSSGAVLNYTYNHQGQTLTISNALGILQSATFDVEGLVTNSVDANGVSVQTTYDPLHRLTSRSHPDGGVERYGYTFNVSGATSYTNQIGHVTRFGYDAMNHKTSEVFPGVTTNQLAYNGAGDLLTLTDGKNQNTLWGYDVFGRVTSKVDALNRTVFNYAYNANGWLTNRWTPEKGDTGYTYDAVGNVQAINYPLSTISYSYDALNRWTNMVDAVGTTKRSYTQTGRLANEDGPWASDTVAYTYAHGLRTALTISQTSSNWAQTYDYDLGRRLTDTASPAGGFIYGFNSPSSPLVTQLRLPNGAIITNSYDNLARLQQTALNDHWGHTLDGYAYQYDLANQRTNLVRNLGLTSSTVNAGYDNIGQLTSWNASETNGLPRWHEQHGWAYDAAGNLRLRTNGALVQSFSVDSVNALTNVTRTGTLTVSGNTPAPVTSVTVNGLTAQLYEDLTFARTNLTLANGQNSFTNIAQNTYGAKATNAYTVNLSVSVVLGYDANGNLTNDGVRSMAYDAENQMTNVQVAGVWKAEFVYDGLNRRRISRNFVWSSGSWLLTSETRLLYDGYLPIQERDSNNVPLVTYTRGLDMSGTLAGAGGIGGLLARADTNGSAYYHADGSGNVTALMDGRENIVARYLYNPFGKLLGMWGTLANANVMRFSSKPYHALAEDYDFGFRRYRPDLQRWTTTDPIQEAGGINLYGYVYNSPLNYVDPDGEAGIAIPFPGWAWPKAPNPVNCAFAAGAAVGTGLCLAFPDAMTKPGEWIGNLVCPLTGGKGERNWGSNDPNPWKGYRPKDPDDPSKGGWKQDPNGKWKPVPRPEGPPPKNHPNW